MSDVTRDGEELIKRWMRAVELEETAKRSLNSAETEVLNSRNALSKWLLPDDAKTGEVIAVWYGDSLIEVTVTNGDPKLRIRSRGKSLMSA